MWDINQFQISTNNSNRLWAIPQKDTDTICKRTIVASK